MLPIHEEHLRAWISNLISLSDDAQKLYLNVAIEKKVSNGAVVQYYLAILDLAAKKIELLSLLQDIFF
jgi:hypothetical protein